ncbi:MAG: sugar transferase [Verrucomicrobia bacterium]|nr:sugar transferase [Verrucomicrobiota bacterium]
MLRRQQLIRMQVQQLLDAGLFGLGLWAAHWLRSLWPNAYFPKADAIEPFNHYLWFYLLIIPFAPLLLESQGFYSRSSSGARRLTVWPLLRACALAVLGLIFVMFVMRMQLARSVIILFGAISFLIILGKEELMRAWARTKLGQSQLKKRLLLVGAIEDTTRLAHDLRQKSHDSIEVVAQLNLNETPVERLADLLHEHSPNGVIVSGTHTYFGQIERAIELCELEGVEVWLLADFFKTQISRTTLDNFHGRPTLVFRSAPEMSWQGLAKQVMDVIGAAAMLLVVGLPMLLVALAIKLTSPGPVLFRQQRSGLNGQPFRMYKFRTMVSDAEQQRQELAAFNEMDGPVFKITNDPRITPLGRLLRKFSVDELPQLWNVLRGEMSLVGPRPLPVDEVRRFNDLAHRRRLSVKPGLTCLWQISGRNEVKDFKDWVRLDLEYIDNWSLWLDLKILLRTVPVVLLGTGAK